MCCSGVLEGLSRVFMGTAAGAGFSQGGVSGDHGAEPLEVLETRSSEI